MTDLSETMFLISQAVKSDLPLGEAIRISLSDENRTLNRRLQHFAALLDNGTELPLAARQAHLPKRLAIAIETAYDSGSFSDYFLELAESERSWLKIFAVLNNALIYPVTLFVIVLCLGFLFCFIVPMFEKITDGFGTSLPLITEFIFWLSHIILQYWAVGFLTFAAFLLLVRLLFPAFLFYLPGTGPIFRGITARRILGQLRLAFLRRVPLSEALTLAGKSFFTNRTLRKHCFQASAEAEAGTAFSDIIIRHPLLFPFWLAPLVKTAEKNGSVPLVLQKGIALIEENYTDAAVLFGAIFSLLCYLCTIFITGFTVIALIMPLVKLITTLSS